MAHKLNQQSRQKIHGLNTIAFAEFCLQLHLGARSRYELAELVGINPSTCGKWIALLESKELVYVAVWKRSSGNNWVSYWLWGFKTPNTPKPRARTNYENHRAWVARKEMKQRNNSTKTPLDKPDSVPHNRYSSEELSQWLSPNPSGD